MTAKRSPVPVCPVCRLHPVAGLAFCGSCGKAYDRAKLDLTHAALIEWTANRAWRFASRKRAGNKP